ncbi:hypothetical protein QBC34DRAFT_498511 [Podospora aff. communis PSN243]|uniref:Uncharacterized protein n=1 Tax=Podospora aff. communis PSN243 TaxID=3040156 RepID=A0AAV9G994_9PEZI|nr:hypothetical protein QBC34DRAFT_498511 [Podospora aff. communis PSN243]
MFFNIFFKSKEQKRAPGLALNPPKAFRPFSTFDTIVAGGILTTMIILFFLGDTDYLIVNTIDDGSYQSKLLDLINKSSYFALIMLVSPLGLHAAILIFLVGSGLNAVSATLRGVRRNRGLILIAVADRHSRWRQEKLRDGPKKGVYFDEEDLEAAEGYGEDTDDEIDVDAEASATSQSKTSSAPVASPEPAQPEVTSNKPTEPSKPEAPSKPKLDIIAQGKRYKPLFSPRTVLASRQASLAQKLDYENLIASLLKDLPPPEFEPFPFPENQYWDRAKAREALELACANLPAFEVPAEATLPPRPRDGKKEPDIEWDERDEDLIMDVLRARLHKMLGTTTDEKEKEKSQAELLEGYKWAGEDEDDDAGEEEEGGEK